MIGLVLKVAKDPWGFWKPQGSQGSVLPFLMVAITMILLIRWTIISPAFQGRLLFPALIGVNVLWVAGLHAIGSKLSAWRHPINNSSLSVDYGVPLGYWSLTPSLILSLFFLIIAMLIPFTHIAPAYAFPEPVNVPAGAGFGPIRYVDENGESISLVGVELEPGQSAVPNDQTGIAVTLYWTTETGVTTNYVSAVHALGRGFKSVGQVDRHPGWGMWPPTRWRPGDVYADPYHVWINPGNADPALLRVDVSILDTSGPKNRILPPTDVDGNTLDLVLVGEAKQGDTPGTEDIVLYKSDPKPVDFTDFVTLVSIEGVTGSFLPASAGGTLTVPLHWRANGTPSKDYTVFVQLISPAGELVASGDAPPLNGDYPTRLWETGESIPDPKQINIPADAEPGIYTILVGMYDPLTGERMQRLDGGDSVEAEIEIRP